MQQDLNLYLFYKLCALPSISSYTMHETLIIYFGLIDLTLNGVVHQLTWNSFTKVSYCLFNDTSKLQLPSHNIQPWCIVGLEPTFLLHKGAFSPIKLNTYMFHTFLVLRLMLKHSLDLNQEYECLSFLMCYHYTTVLVLFIIDRP